MIHIISGMTQEHVYQAICVRCYQTLLAIETTYVSPIVIILSLVPEQEADLASLLDPLQRSCLHKETSCHYKTGANVANLFNKKLTFQLTNQEKSQVQISLY